MLTVATAPKIKSSKRFKSAREAISEGGAMFLSDIIAAVGSKDGREVIMELDEIRQDGKLMRDSTQICLGDAAGSRNRASFMFPNSNVANRPVETSINYLDSPATTSEITYTVKIRDDSGAGSSVYLNRGAIDTDSSAQYRLASTLICMEVVA